MLVEVCNALFQKARQGQLTVTDAADLLEGLTSEDIIILDPPRIHSRALELAGVLQQNAVYDAHYLALAEALDCGYWTADERFHNAVVNDFPRVHFIGET